MPTDRSALESARTPGVVTDASEAAALVRLLHGAGRVAVDLESNGLFAYRPDVCVVQLAATVPGESTARVVLIDTLAVAPTVLAPLLEDTAVVKLVHDVAFDARMLAAAGVSLRNVVDTSIAARMLGIQATGLASLLQAQLGIGIDKSLQHHDWGKRPIDPRTLPYLEADVVHLDALAEALWRQVEAAGIELEVAEETRYRLEQAIASAHAVDDRLPYMRLKGIDRVGGATLAILRHLAALREARARQLDVPPYKVLGPETLFAIAERKPRTMAELEQVRGATSGGRARAMAREVLAAVAQGLTEGDVPPEERARLVKPRLAGSAARARREREQRLSRWRKVEAQKRGVDEQVVLPGHCLADLADLDDPTPESVRSVAGIGDFRVERDAGAWIEALTEDRA